MIDGIEKFIAIVFGGILLYIVGIPIIGVAQIATIATLNGALSYEVRLALGIVALAVFAFITLRFVKARY